MKILYCLNSIGTNGGIEKVTREKANYFSQFPDMKVYIAVSDFNKNTNNDLSSEIIIVDLKIGYYIDDWKSKLNVLKGIILKRRKHRKKLTKVLYEIKPDIVISVGQSEKYFLPEIKGEWKTIREFHYDKKYRIRTSNSFLQKLGAHFLNIYDYKFKIKKYDRIVVLTDDDKRINWKNNLKVTVIPNPVPTKNLGINCYKDAKYLENKKIITAGRLVKAKNFSSLINAFKYVVDRYPEWVLEIYGEGELKDKLQQEIISLNLKDKVFLKGYCYDMITIMKESSIFVMSSLYEGMPMVLLEALACGLPIISYDCPYGPRNLIQDGKTGYLVPLNDEIKLADRICLLIENHDLRKELGKNAFIYSNNYSIQRICSTWFHLFKGLLKESQDNDICL